MLRFRRARISRALAGLGGARADATAVVVMVALAVCPAPAVAADIDADAVIERLSALMQAADFDAAEREARRALASGALGRLAAARVYLHLGIVAAARHDDGAAARAFDLGLALDPELELPAFAGPHVARPFARARARASAAPPLAVAAHVGRGHEAHELDVRVVVSGDRGGLLRRVRVRGGSL